MNLITAIQKIAAEYVAARSQPFKAHPLAIFIRRDWVRFAQELCNIDTTAYKVDASPGKGTWSESPWLAFLDPQVTTSAQSGYYPVFLFEPGMKTFCLVLGQGATSLERSFGKAEALRVVADRARWLRRQSGDWEKAGFTHETFRTLARLEASGGSAKEDTWSQSVAFGKRYFIDAPPTPAQLKLDVLSMLELYRTAVANIGQTFHDEEQVAENLAGSGELPQTGLDGAKKIHLHKSFERRHRNGKLAKAAKEKHGYRCQACLVDLKTLHSSLDKPLIEAHHLSPLGAAPKDGVQLTVDDFCSLCPSCHRIIHQMGCPTLHEFANAVDPDLKRFNASR